MAAFIPIFIIEKVGRRPLMLFGVCDPLASMNRYSANAFESLGCWNVDFYGHPRRN